MDAFKGVSAAVAMVLGLGVTRLLSGFVIVFRARRAARTDWIPCLWGGYIFLWQLQFWWTTVDLAHAVPVWTRANFIALVLLALMLFLAAALVLPVVDFAAGDNLGAYFERDGRWSLAPLSAYFILAVAVNAIFGDGYPHDALVWLGACILLPLVFLRVSSRRWRGAITLAYLPLSCWTALRVSPDFLH